jgi:hypothetical protein
VPGGTEFVPVPDDGTDRVTSRKDFSALVVPFGAPDAEYRFRYSADCVSLSTRFTNEFPAIGRAVDG